MTAIYTAATPLEAEILRAYLAIHDIGTRVLGTELWSARGELAVDSYPRLWLEDERDRERAEALLQQYRQPRPAGLDWRCRCGEPVPADFDSCWSCGSLPTA